jgi:hypothetical protein
MHHRGYFCLFFDKPSQEILQSMIPNCKDFHVTNLVIDDPEEIARLQDILHFIGNSCYSVDVNENLRPVEMEHPISIKIIGIGKLKTRNDNIVDALKITSLPNTQLDNMKYSLMSRFGLESDYYKSDQIYHITIPNLPPLLFENIPILKLTSCVFSARG